MSDPSIVLNSPTNTWEYYRQTSLRVEEISLNQDIRVKREEDITHFHLHPLQLLPLCHLTRKVKSQRGPYTHIRKEESLPRLLLLLHNL